MPGFPLAGIADGIALLDDGGRLLQEERVA